MSSESYGPTCLVDPSDPKVGDGDGTKNTPPPIFKCTRDILVCNNLSVYKSILRVSCLINRQLECSVDISIDEEAEMCQSMTVGGNKDYAHCRIYSESPGMFVLRSPLCSVASVDFVIHMGWLETSTVTDWMVGKRGPVDGNKLRIVLEHKKYADCIFGGILNYSVSIGAQRHDPVSMWDILKFLITTKKCAAMDVLHDTVLQPMDPQCKLREQMFSSFPNKFNYGDIVTTGCPHCIHKAFPSVFPRVLCPEDILSISLKHIYSFSTAVSYEARQGHRPLKYIIDMLLCLSGWKYAFNAVISFLKSNFKHAKLQELSVAVLNRWHKKKCCWMRNEIWDTLDVVRAASDGDDDHSWKIPYNELLQKVGLKVIRDDPSRALRYVSEMGENGMMVDTTLTNDNIIELPELIPHISSKRMMISSGRVPLLFRCVLSMNDVSKFGYGSQMMIKRIMDITDWISDNYYYVVTANPNMMRQTLAVCRDKAADFPLVLKMYRRMRSNMAKLLVRGIYSPESVLSSVGAHIVQYIVNALVPRPENVDFGVVRKKKK